ncbi:uncharacterized protein VTP21DRAFT_6568 [Calcarisporiella thermophila]|uniref:uncharacterized protein n=1 Tax=Calcarisporiella thermophila TaxID=911321 RepID=UPI003744B017
MATTQQAATIVEEEYHVPKIPLTNFVLRPIAQVVINQSVLEFDIVEIAEPRENEFKASIRGLISNAGPFPAKITFQKPITLLWRNRKLASMRLPPLKTSGTNGAALDMVVEGRVLDHAAMTDSCAYMMNNENFEWEVLCDHLDISVLGINIVGLKMRKKLPLKGMNAFRGSVSVNSWDLPADEPDGITLVSNFGILNPSAIGMTGNHVVFNLFYKDTVIGRIYMDNQPIRPFTRNVFDLKGVFLPQKTSQGIAILSEMFSNYVSGIHNPVYAVGVEVHGPDGRVEWLSNAIQQLRFDVVIPSPKRLQVISELTLKDYEIVFEPGTDGYSPITSNKNAEITMKLPFNFMVNVKHVEATLEICENGKKLAEMAHISTPVQCNPEPGGGFVRVGYPRTPMVMNPAMKDSLHRFMDKLTLESDATIELTGIINANIECAVGTLEVRGNRFENKVRVQGMNGLRTKMPEQASPIQWSNIGKGKVGFSVIASYFNPGIISAHVGDVHFDLYYNDTKVGSASISNLSIVPSNSTVRIRGAIDVTNPNKSLVDLALAWSAPDGVLEFTGRGHRASTEIESLKHTFSKFSLPIKISRTFNGNTTPIPPELEAIMKLLQ